MLETTQAGDVNYADVDNKGGGVVHFSTRDGMDYALRKLDGSEFSNRYDNATISVSTPGVLYVVIARITATILS